MAYLLPNTHKTAIKLLKLAEQKIEYNAYIRPYYENNEWFVKVKYDMHEEIYRVIHTGKSIDFKFIDGKVF